VCGFWFPPGAKVALAHSRNLHWRLIFQLWSKLQMRSKHRPRNPIIVDVYACTSDFGNFPQVKGFHQKVNSTCHQVVAANLNDLRSVLRKLGWTLVKMKKSLHLQGHFQRTIAWETELRSQMCHCPWSRAQDSRPRPRPPPHQH
jgi:hypothetical protein